MGEELVGRAVHGSGQMESTWDYNPARLQGWDMEVVRAPSTPAAPSLEAMFSTSVFEQRIQHAIMQLAALRDGGRGVEDMPDIQETENAVSQQEIQSMLSLVPLEKLSKKMPEPCSICHESMRPGEQCRRLPCFHIFHRECIDRWLGLRGTCPLDKLLLSDMLQQ